MIIIIKKKKKTHDYRTTVYKWPEIYKETCTICTTHINAWYFKHWIRKDYSKALLIKKKKLSVLFKEKISILNENNGFSQHFKHIPSLLKRLVLKFFQNFLFL